MSKKTGYLLGMLLTIIICMILAYIFCCNTGAFGSSDTSTENTTVENPDVDAVAATPTTTSMPFNLKGPDGNFAFNSNDNENFNFNVSKFSILTPLSPEIDKGIGELKTYFDTDGNENKKIDITGYYTEDEENASAFSNLGFARANTIKNYFVEQGIPSDRINTYGKLKNSFVPDNDIYRGPVSYNIFAQAAEDKKAEQEEMSQLANSIRKDPLILYFEYGEGSVTLNEQQRTKLSNISRYLDKVEGATIIVEGHTDSEGAQSTNNRLGLKRANTAKDYLIANGIPNAKIKTVSKGENQPIASNDTEEGRSENRRAVITIN